MSDPTPAWQQINNLFARFSVTPPPWRLRDELVIMLAERDALRAEVARLRGDRIGTHSPDCWSYGQRHYECAVAEIKRLREAGECGWLIEWPASEDSYPRWWHPARGWSVHAARGIRYSRKQDAEAAIATSRFVSGVRATDHQWVSPAPPTVATSAEAGPGASDETNREDGQ